MSNECPVCGEGWLIHSKEKVTTTPTFYDFEVTIESEWSTCNVCLSEIASPEQINRNAEAMRAAIKERLDRDYNG